MKPEISTPALAAAIKRLMVAKKALAAARGQTNPKTDRQPVVAAREEENREKRKQR